MRLQIFGLFAAVAFAFGGWGLAHYRGLENDTLELSVQQLEQDKRNLVGAYEYLSTERDRLGRLYAENRRENARVQSILERQLKAMRAADGDPCADVSVSDERIQWLRQPVWIDTPHAVPSDP